MKQPLKQSLNWLAQGVLYAGFAGFVGYFATAPAYSPLGPDQALIKVSFSQHGKLVSECRKRTPEELAKLAPNMRTPMDCKRERSPLKVEVVLDGQPVYQHEAMPSGLSRDGAATAYKRFVVKTGEHQLKVLFKDDIRHEGYTHERNETIKLARGQVLVIDFNPEKGGITLQ